MVDMENSQDLEYTGYCFNRDVNDPDEVTSLPDHRNGRIKPDEMRLLIGNHSMLINSGWVM